MTDSADSVDRRPPSEISASGARSDAAEQITGSVSTTDHCPIGPRQVHLGGRVLLAPREVSAPAGTHNLPRPRSAVFVGRDPGGAALAGVAESGLGAVTHAIQGPGGIGKTELALRHAWTHKDCYSLMWWVVADAAGNVDAGLAELAYRLQPAMKTVVTTPEAAAAWARTWLQTHTRWLLVLDNVEDPQHVTAPLGQLDAGRILITTRCDLDWHRYGATPVRLGPLERAESIELVTRLTGRDEPKAANSVADELGDLPLTLEQAAADITERRTSISAYLTQLHNQPDLFVDTPTLSQPAERAVARVTGLARLKIELRELTARYSQIVDKLARQIAQTEQAILAAEPATDTAPLRNRDYVVAQWSEHQAPARRALLRLAWTEIALHKAAHRGGPSGEGRISYRPHHPSCTCRRLGSAAIRGGDQLRLMQQMSDTPVRRSSRGLRGPQSRPIAHHAGRPVAAAPHSSPGSSHSRRRPPIGSPCAAGSSRYRVSKPRAQ
jgi:NB-ARC domain